MEKSKLVERKEVLDDLVELLNNLEDDINNESPEQAVHDTKRFTLLLLRQKYIEYGGHIVNEEKNDKDRY